MRQNKIINENEISWDIDIDQVKKIQKWANKFPKILKQEIEEMNEFFPRWLFTISNMNGKIITCSRCGNTIVPFDEKIACISCGLEFKNYKDAKLSWVGQIPILISERKKVLTKLRKKENSSFPLVTLKDGNIYCLVPITIVYPDNFPNEQPYCYYLPEFIETIKVSQNFGIHLLGGYRMCLFGYDEWNSITVREVIQQRVINHIMSIIKIADGIDPNTAFIGKTI